MVLRLQDYTAAERICKTCVIYYTTYMALFLFSKLETSKEYTSWCKSKTPRPPRHPSSVRRKLYGNQIKVLTSSSDHGSRTM